MEDNNQVVIFKLGTETFGLSIKRIKEIINVDKLSSIPNTPEYILPTKKYTGRKPCVFFIYEP
jgi:chemotaxis signal transduction protein